MPASASTGVKEEGFRSRTARLSPLMPLRLKSQAVTVVPMLAPMITPMACRSAMRPEFTKPTTITVVAEDDCITEVIPNPVRTPLKGFEVILESRVRSLLPAAFCNPELIKFIP